MAPETWSDEVLGNGWIHSWVTWDPRRCPDSQSAFRSVSDRRQWSSQTERHATFDKLFRLDIIISKIIGSILNWLKRKLFQCLSFLIFHLYVPRRSAFIPFARILFHFLDISFLWKWHQKPHRSTTPCWRSSVLSNCQIAGGWGGLGGGMAGVGVNTAPETL